MIEVTAEQLITRAIETLSQHPEIGGWIICIEDFARHASHVLRVFRPEYRVQGCVLLGPKGSGKSLLLQCAAAMCNHQVLVETPDTPLEFTMLQLRKALSQRCVRACVRACVRVCVRACMHACARVCIKRAFLTQVCICASMCL